MRFPYFSLLSLVKEPVSLSDQSPSDLYLVVKSWAGSQWVSLWALQSRQVLGCGAPYQPVFLILPGLSSCPTSIHPPPLHPTLPQHLQLLQQGQSQEGSIPEPSDLVVAQEPEGTGKAQENVLLQAGKCRWSEDPVSP